MAKGKKILVVDDDQDILDLLEYNLEREGFRVRTTTRSTEALSAAIEWVPDLIILDIMMPGLNGIELCKKIRELSDFEDTVIFFLPHIPKSTTRRPPSKRVAMTSLKKWWA